MASTPPVGSVDIEVRAPLDKLVKDFADGRKAAEAFDRDVGSKLGPSSRRAASDVDKLGDRAKGLRGDFKQAEDAAHRYENAIRRAGSESQRQTRRIAANAAAMGAAVGSFVGILGAQASSAILRASGDALRYAASLKGLSQQLGVSTEDLQVYTYAGRQVGMTAEEVEQGLKNLTKTIGEAATGSVRDTKALQLVGFTLKEIKSGALTAGEALPRIADMLSRIPNPAQRAAVELALFGEAGQKLDPLLSQGSKGIDNLRNAAKRLGVVLSEDEIQNADDTANKLEDVKQVLEANIASVVAQNAGAIVGLAQSLGALTGSIVQFFGSNPERALAILGALGGGLAGLRFGGPIGGLIGTLGGAAGGAKIGSNMRRTVEDSNMDLGFRREQAKKANAALAAARGQGVVGNIRNNSFTDPQGRKSVEGATAELQRQNALLKQAIDQRAAALAGGGKPPPLDKNLQNLLNNLNAPAAPKGRKGRTPVDKTDQNEHAYQQALERSERDYLRLQEDMTTDIETLAELQRRRIDLDERGRAEDIEYQRKRGQLTAAQAEQLQLENKRNFALERDILAREVAEKNAQNLFEVQALQLEGANELLRLQDGLATTAAERRTLQLQMLDNEYALQQLELDRIIASTESTKTEVELAKIKKQQLTTAQGAMRAAVIQGSRGPLESYLSGLPQTANEVQEALQRLQVQGFEELDRRTQSFADNFVGAFDRAAEAILNLEDPIDIVANLLQDLAQQFTREFVLQPVSDWMRRKVAAPVAEKLIGGTASSSGLDAAQINAAFQQGILSVGNLAIAAQRASLILQQLGTTGVQPLGDIATQTQQSFQELNPQIDQTGSALMGIISSFTGGGGAGGAIPGLFSLGASLLGGGGGGGGNSDILAMMAAAPNAFADGGWVGGTGGPRADNQLVRTSVGEHITNAFSARKHAPLLNAINADRLPGFRGGDWQGAGSAPGKASRTLQFGDIVLPGVTDERSGRRAAKQVSAELQRRLATTAREGIAG